MSITLTIDDAIEYLPNLSPANRQRLYDELRRLGEGINYYFDYAEPHKLQGDVWGNVPHAFFDGGEPRLVLSSGMIVSNSCDIDPRNERHTPSFVLVAPVQRMVRFRAMLEAAGLNADQVESRIRAVRDQKVTNAFYLPERNGAIEESLVLLDQLSSVPVGTFNEATSGRRVVLSQAAFWLLLMKLSVHMCRQHEGVERY